MPKSDTSRPKLKIVIISVVILAIVVGGFLAFNAGLLGGESCAALVRKYEKASKVEDYPTVTETFSKLSEKGCDF
jgi:hypothetical protein